MNRILEFLRGRLGGSADATDRHLLDRFLGERDETAFAELVCRHGPVVWGVCRRRLANPHDAEDAFQATFLVLVRRAARLAPDVPLGPWLHRVAVLTTRNIVRGNRRRAAVSGPMDHEIPAAGGEPRADHLDLDAALIALPESYRVPVVLCHLQGLSRREAATQLGCPEGTLSARLNRALARLRARLGGAVPAVAVAAVPGGLHAAAVRLAVIDTTSTLTAAGVSPAVAGITNGVLRMFWMKKLATGSVLAGLLVGGVLAGFTVRSDGAARATDSPATDPQPPVEDPQAKAKRIAFELAKLKAQQDAIAKAIADIKAEQDKVDAVMKQRAAVDELGTDLAIVVTEGGNGPSYIIREVVNQKVGEVYCSDPDVLARYLTRTFNDPKGPKNLRIAADKDAASESVRKVFEACAAAGYKKVSFTVIPPEFRFVETARFTTTGGIGYFERTVIPAKPTDIDLTKYAPAKK